MPIVRTFQCPECNHRLEVTLRADQWDAPPPSCPACDEHDMQQQFKPPAIGGSVRARAVRLAEDIVSNDYGVADFKAEGKEGGAVTHRLKDFKPGTGGSTWGASGEMLEAAVSIGRQTRLQHGNGLDVLKSALETGKQVDLIEASKRRAIKVW